MNIVELTEELNAGLEILENSGLNMPGIRYQENRDTLVKQMIDSIKRVEFIYVIKSRHISHERTDPQSLMFDPIRAAIWHNNNCNKEEASWLVFLLTHFGNADRTNWRLVRDVYGQLGNGTWDWKTVLHDPHAIYEWLCHNSEALASRDTKFGNHRKYESLTPGKQGWTGDIIESYLNWVQGYGSHTNLFNEALHEANNDPRRSFNILFRSMKPVHRFGRTAKFDYLTMISKTGISDIIADKAYLSGSTGPIQGARLLFGGSTSARLTHRNLEEKIFEINGVLQVGMQVLEDSLCNWQKNPGRYVKFRG